MVSDVALGILCSMFPRSTHETFAEKLYQTLKDHKRFSKPKLSRSDFTICHYAGDVSIWNSFGLASNMPNNCLTYIYIYIYTILTFVLGHLSNWALPG